MAHFLSLRLVQVCSLIVSTTYRETERESDIIICGQSSSHLVTFLLLVWTAGLAETDTAASVLDSLALLLVVHLADLVIDGVALLVLHRLAHVLVHGLAGGAG